MTELFDIVLRRQIYVEGLKAQKSAEWSQALAQLRSLLQQRLADIDANELGDLTKTALFKLIADLKRIARKVFDPWLTSLIDWLRRYLDADLVMLTRLFAPHTESDLADASDNDKLWAAATNAPIEATGTLALPFLLALSPSIAVKLERLVMQHYASRSTINELRNALIGTSAARFNDSALRSLRLQGEAATNTVLQHLANQVAFAVGNAEFGFYEWVSVLDNRTTVICEFRNGRRYRYGHGPIPPAHFNCRSTIVPVGADDPVRPDFDFRTWLQEQPTEFVKDAFDGRYTSRYEGASAITLSDFVRKFELIGL